MQSEDDKNLYQVDFQTVSMIKDIRHNVHNIVKEHLEKKVRIEAIDGQVFEGVIVDFDDQNVYVEVEDPDYDPDAEIDDLQVEEVASRHSFDGEWGGDPWYSYGGYDPYQEAVPYPVGFGYPYPGYGPFGSSSNPYGQMNPFGYGYMNPYGQVNPFGGSSNYPGYPPFGNENAPFSQVSPYHQGKGPLGQVSPYQTEKGPFSQVSPYYKEKGPFGQVSPYQTENAPFSQVSPYQTENAPFSQVSPFGGQNPYLSPFPPFPPIPCYPCLPPPPPPPPPPQAAVVVPPKRRRRPCRSGRKIIPLALFTLLTIALL